MSSLPCEVVVDTLVPLDRWTLDAVQSTNRRFQRLIDERMSDVCLREIRHAKLDIYNASVEAVAKASIHFNGPPQLQFANHKYIVPLKYFTAFVASLRSSRIDALDVSELPITPGISALFLEGPIIAEQLNFDGITCATVSPAQFHSFILHLSPSSLRFDGGRFRAEHISDELIRALCKNGTTHMRMPSAEPTDGGSYNVTDDAIVHFCVEQDVGEDEERRGVSSRPYGEMVLHHTATTPNLFKRLVEASTVSKRTESLRIVVCPSRVGNEELRDFAQHLSHRHQPHLAVSVYNFTDVQRGAADGMHVQMALHRNDALEMIRARRPHRLFYMAQDDD